MTVPLVCGLAGNGSWLVYALSSLGFLLLALCISRFARHTASPGSLYHYATASLPAWVSGVAGWSLLLAYIGTGASVAGGFATYANVLLRELFNKSFSPAGLIALVVAVATVTACRNLQLSARLMLGIEAISALLVLIVLALVVHRNGLHLDTAQASLHGVSSSGIRAGILLAMFSFVGFESATTLGHEARDPLRSLPRVVVLSAVLSGAFFIFTTYAETLGMHRAGAAPGSDPAPFRLLARLVHIPVLGLLIDAGVFVSMFACTLACTIAAARVMLLMGTRRLLPARLGLHHPVTQSPFAATLCCGVFILLPAVGLALHGMAPEDIYGAMGAFAVFGFLFAYGLAVLALPVFLKRLARPSPAITTLCAATLLALLAALAGTLYPVPPPPYNVLPYVFAGCLSLGLCLSFAISRTRRRAAPVASR